MSESIVQTRKLRRAITAEQKLLMVQESHQPGVVVAEIARKYDVAVSSLIKWRKNVLEGSLMGVKDDVGMVSASEAKKLKKEINQLQRLLGKQTLQIELLKDAVDLAHEKKLISLQTLLDAKSIVND